MRGIIMNRKKAGLIGRKLGHSYSKRIHRMFGEYEYDLCEVEEGQLEALIRSGKYDGFNVTIPYKKTVMKYCDELSDRAKEIGSVNTILCKEDGKIIGDNTDAYGFSYMIQSAGIPIKGRKCLVLGSGGASLTVQAVLKEQGAAEIIVVSRNGMNNYDNIDKQYDSHVIVNTTPVGMYPNNGKTLLDLQHFTNCVGVLDLIYNPYRTQLVLDAIERKIPAAGGMGMLVAQAKRASELFQDKQICEKQMKDVLKKITEESLNTILIGMPGSGKTFIGKKIAKKTGKQFIDIDEKIVEQEKMSIPEIFEQKGEDYFRAVETEVLKKYCACSGMVISTGGGIVTRERNKSVIRQNGKVIWIQREINHLETDGRPLSQKGSLEALYHSRKSAYKKWSDEVYCNCMILSE